ncbi:MAG TPA: hypothetical protein VFN09_08850 [Rhodanobacteraceae bacterium]|nr:hypothetical protein [Rhodanobacteraceae bacterium]
MSQRSSHRHVTLIDRLTTIDDVLQQRGSLIITLVLVLLIINGGAG